MPPKRTFFKYKEEDVVKAIEEISKGAKIRETCRKYNIPHTTVINKMKLRYPVQRKMGPPTILTTQEESLLKTWILAMANKGFPVNKEMVVETVKKIITEENRPNPFKDNTPGRKWFSSFLKRHPDIATRHAESINISRRLVTENALRKWHANLKEYLVAEDVADILQDPARIINADESGVWPSESPIKRNQKNRKRVRLPDAVNSSEWMKYWKEKEKIKKEREEKKSLKTANREKISKKNKKQETDSDEETPVSTRKVRRLRIYSDSDDDNVPLIVHKSIEVTQKPEKGDYVIVRYEGEYFPGIVENTEGKLYEISTMIFSAGNTFRWPEQCDKIWYQEDKIEEKIAIPTLANSRGFYRVPEMDKFMPKCD